VSAVFYLVVAAMLGVALAVVLIPLVRHGRREGRPRGVFGTAAVVGVLMPVASVALYLLVGTPATVAGVTPAHEMTVDEAMAGLEARVHAHPDDVQAWLMLGQARSMLKQPAPARDAYEAALKADPGNASAMVGWAEADSLARQFQHEQFTQAAATWRQLQPLLDPDSNVARAVTEQIAVAEKRATQAGSH
jgi:cytochrome c-type biogenesis protein CcmH